MTIANLGLRALMGLFGFGIRARIQESLYTSRPRRGKHFDRNRNSRKVGRARLEPARGAGSINAEADMQQLIRLGNWDAEKRDAYYAKAAEIYELHNARVGCPKMRWGDLWMETYRRGTPGVL